MDNDGATITPAGFGDVIIGNQGKILNDGDTQMRWESRVHSGDYFTTLATELEDVANHTKDNVVEIRLRAMVDELEYIQMHYNLKKKQS